MVRIIFNGTLTSATSEHELEVFVNVDNEIHVRITDTESEHGFNIQHICLDKRTAIKLHRELKKQISFITEEVDNG
jgi:hypothetical protein